MKLSINYIQIRRIQFIRSVVYSFKLQIRLNMVKYYIFFILSDFILLFGFFTNKICLSYITEHNLKYINCYIKPDVYRRIQCIRLV